jgi:ADP-heptose:LPS heptosyltransferase/GT2 family glycosyltransferase
MSEIVIFDNGSDEENLKQLRGWAEMAMGLHPSFHVRIIQGDDNTGYGFAHNYVARNALGEYFIIANNDMVFSEMGWASKLIAELNDEVLQAGGDNGGNCNLLSLKGEGSRANIAEPEYCEGVLFAMKTEWAQRLGPFDGHFEMAYCEDSDLSLRLRAMGYKIKTVPIGFEHKRATTSDDLAKKNILDVKGYAIKNSLKFVKRWIYYLKFRKFSPKIAILRGAAIGDVLAAEAVVEKIKSVSPFAEIDFFTSCPDMLKNNPHIKNIYPVEAAGAYSNQYACLINLDLRYEKESHENMIEVYYKAAGFTKEEMEEETDGYLSPKIYLTEEEIKAGASTLMYGSEADSKSIWLTWVVFHTGRTNWSGRNLPVEKFRKAAEWLIGKGWDIVEIGDKATEPLGVESLDLRGKLTVRETAAVMKHCRLFVGIDSFPWHIAQCFDIPSVVTFGMINPDTRIYPKNEKCYPVQAKKVKCLGCHHEQIPPVLYSQCPRDAKAEYAPCMRHIKAEDIIEKIEEAIKGME